MTTIQDIADKLNISKGTVSKALNNAPDISETLQKQILETAVELGYTKLRRYKNAQRKLCIIVQKDNIQYKESHQFAYDILIGFRQMAEPAGFEVDVVPVDIHTQRQFSYDVFMLQNDYAGAFVIGFSLGEPWMKDFQTSRTPAVLYDNHIIGKSNTPIKNILSTIDGKLLCGDPQACISTGKTTIAASSRDVMDDYIQKDDLVITANRPDAQNAAIRNGACCVIICGPHRISREILDYAVRNRVTMIETAHDTYTTARLINHSMPVKSFMAHENLLCFKLSDSVEHAREVMTKHRVRDYPVLDTEGHDVGLISRRTLLGLK